MNMKKVVSALFFILIFSFGDTYAQSSLPEITVKNYNGKIIISWLNDYKKKVSDILIQRSYDSLKNYTTIGTVLIPQNLENGYPDLNAPYNKMYYRVTIVFEGGTYIVGPSTRPVKEKIASDITDSAVIKIVKETEKKDSIILINQPKDKPVINLVSKRIYTGKNNHIVIDLPDASLKKYNIKFYDESRKLVVDLKKISEDYLFIEKVNFIRSGWFNFEIYCDDILVEKNSIYINKDPKVPNR
jgi:hypothetical protein